MANIFGEQKVIMVLGGGMKKDESGRWRTTNFDEQGDNFGVLGDRMRVLAAGYLYKEDNNLLIVASGGKGQFKDISDAPNISQVLKEELIELEVPPEKIIEENVSGTTYEQLKAAKDICDARGIKELNIISNRWHLPRVKAMLDNFPELKEMAVNFNFIEAEEIVLGHNSEKWKEIIECAYQGESMRNRIELEKKGIEDIEKGRYKLNKSSLDKEGEKWK